MADLQTPPEIEAHVRALAEASGRDVQAVYEEVLLEGLKATQKRALDHRLKVAHDEYLAGNFVTAEQALAMLDEE